MAMFYGELQLEGDSDRLPTVVKVEAGALSLSSGRTAIGKWKLYEVRLLDMGDRIVLTADQENVLLYLTEHASFTAEVENFLRKPDEKRGRRLRREPRHPAFEKKVETPKQPKEPRAAAVRQELVEEASPILADAKQLLRKINPGPTLWAVIAAFVITLIFFPSVLFGVLLTVGLLAVLIGVVGYMDNTIAARFPNRLPPTRLMLGGGLALVVAVLVIVVR